nr:hypothetical protein [Tanacetum cinerariifolium]
METKDTLSSCSNLDEQKMQQLQKQEKILKENSLNKFNALKTTTQRLKRQTFTNCLLFQRAFSHLFHTDVRTFNSGEKDCSGIVLDKGNDQSLENQSNTSGDKSSKSRNECTDKSTSGDDTDIKPSYDMEPVVEVPYTAEYNVFVVDTQHSEQPECIINTFVVEKVDSNVILDSPNMCDNEIQTNQNAIECDDEHVVLANLSLDVDENKKIQKQLKKANTSLAHELKECKFILTKTSRTLRESNSI